MTDDELDCLFACLTDGTVRQQECFFIIASKRTCDINEMTVKGKPLLVAACESGIAMEKICLMLLEQGADVHAIDRVHDSSKQYQVVFLCEKPFRRREKQHCMLLVLEVW